MQKPFHSAFEFSLKNSFKKIKIGRLKLELCVLKEIGIQNFLAQRHFKNYITQRVLSHLLNFFSIFDNFDLLCFFFSHIH